MPAPDYVPARYNTWASVTPAAGATDLFVIAGSTQPVVVRRVRIYASQTSAAPYVFYLVKRTAFDIGGTPAFPTAIATDSNMTGTPTTLITYSTNPSGLGASPGNFMMRSTTIPAGALAEVLDFDFGDRPIVLRGTQLLAVFGGGVSFGAGITLLVQCTWDEGGAV